MYEAVKQKVYEANMELYRRNLVIYTWGNVSEKIGEFIAIKPSGVEYEKMKPNDMVIVDIDGNIKEGKLKPSSDLKTHLELYKACDEIKGICHTHSNYATSFAQAGLPIIPLGTTHADYFFGTIPCTIELKKEEVVDDYEINTGKVIVEEFKNKSFLSVPAAIVKSHGVFTWGKSAKQAVENAVILEEIAKMNFQTHLLNKNIHKLRDYITNKHYQRKHGINAYYGQQKF